MGDYEQDDEQTKEELFQFLKHGDKAHQTWLRAAIFAFFAGEPRPPQQ